MTSHHVNELERVYAQNTALMKRKGMLAEMLRTVLSDASGLTEAVVKEAQDLLVYPVGEVHHNKVMKLVRAAEKVARSQGIPSDVDLAALRAADAACRDHWVNGARDRQATAASHSDRLAKAREAKKQKRESA